MTFNPNFAFIEHNIRAKRIIALQGGTRSGKTYSALQWIIRNCIAYKGLTYSIVRQTLPALKASAYRDFIEILNTSGLYREANHNMSEYTYSLNGNLIEFNDMNNAVRFVASK